MLKSIYYYIDKFDKDEIDKLNPSISIIYRNYIDKVNIKEIKNLLDCCKRTNRKVYISNNLKLALKFNFSGIYIPSSNKLLNFKNLTKKKFELIGSAHNVNEVIIKEKQGCTTIFLCPVFKTKKNKNFLGITKFNLIRLYTKKKIIALGGINQKNIKKLKLCNVKGVASISWVKKNGPSINTGPF